MSRVSYVGGVLLGLAWAAGASTIIDVESSSGVPNTNTITAYASWSQTTTYQNVSVSAQLASESGTATGTAFLTTQVGTGATSAQEVPGTGAAAISISNTVAAPVTLFSGLTLGPGTYYLVIYIPEDSTLEWLYNSSDAVTVTTGTNVTNNGGSEDFPINTTYPPASTFSFTKDLLYTVTGSASVGSVPDLSLGAIVAAVMLLGASGLLLLKRYRPTA